MRSDRQGSREFTPSMKGSYAKSSYLNSNGSINIPEMKLINCSHSMRPQLMARTHSLTYSELEVEFKWIIAALPSSLWRTAKGVKLCEISLSFLQLKKRGITEMAVEECSWNSSSDLLQGTKKALQPCWWIQGSSAAQSLMTVFADNVAWYFKICINRNP